MSTMTGQELLLDSLRRRMRAMHSLYYDAVATMDLHHVNHFEREGVLPIAFSLFHYTNMQDVSFAVISGEPVLWNAEWQARVRMAIDDHGKERTVDEMVHTIGDTGVRQYQRAVFGRMAPTIDQPKSTVASHPLPPTLADTFSARVAGERGITVLDALECWIYQHGLRHMGEIELARGLVGLGGMTS